MNNAFISLGQIVGPIWASLAIDMHLSLPYLSGAAILFAGFVISLLALPQEGRGAYASRRMEKAAADWVMI